MYNVSAKTHLFGLHSISKLLGKRYPPVTSAGHFLPRRLGPLPLLNADVHECPFAEDSFTYNFHNLFVRLKMAPV